MIPRLDLEPPPSRRHVTTDQAAEILSVPAATVRQWASRGHLAPVGKASGRPMYLLADVLTCWATRRSAA